MEPGLQTHRRWQVTDPIGKHWSVTCCPPTTAAELAATWPAGTALEPVPDAPTQPACPALDGATEAKILAWLASIGEADLPTIREVLEICAQDASVLELYLSMSAKVPVENSLRNEECCGTCLNFQRGTHPRLGICQAGGPAPTCGQFWDTDQRRCPNWGPKP